jgi:Trk K+ transport system NAD-binding subunit
VKGGFKMRIAHAAANHSARAHSIYEMEVALHRAYREVAFNEWRYEDKTLSDLRHRLRKDWENAAAKRRRIMKGPNDGDHDDA